MAETNARALRRETCARAAAVAALFCAALAAGLAFNHAELTRLDPLAAGERERLRTQLLEQPDAAELKVELRALDYDLRREYFRLLQFHRNASLLLAAGAAALLLCLRLTRHFSPEPEPERSVATPPADEAPRLRRAALAGLGLLGAGAGAWGLFAAPPDLRISTANADTQTATQETKILAPATREEMLANWPRFRGPDGLGVVASGAPPREWDGPSGKNVRWKAAVPLPGENSPVVWENRVFLSGADREKREVYCFAADTGTLLWEQTVAGVPGSPAEPPAVMDSTGYAAPGLATDGARLFALFSNGDFACFSLDGVRLWQKNLGAPDNAYGQASSLATAEGLLLVQYDQGYAPEDGKSFLFGIDSACGAVKWKTPRPVGGSWSSPITYERDGRTVVVCAATPWVISYDAQTGKERWRVKLDLPTGNADFAASPACAGGVVYAGNDNVPLTAIREGGSGDATATHTLWRAAGDPMPDTSSLLATGKHVYVALSDGTVACYSADSGKKLWSEKVGAAFQGSPALAGDTVYLTDEDGTTFLFRDADAYEPLGRNELGEKSGCSPAFKGKRLYLRGKNHLFCIGSGE